MKLLEFSAFDKTVRQGSMKVGRPKTADVCFFSFFFNLGDEVVSRRSYESQGINVPIHLEEFSITGWSLWLQRSF